MARPGSSSASTSRRTRGYVLRATNPPRRRRSAVFGIGSGQPIDLTKFGRIGGALRGGRRLAGSSNGSVRECCLEAVSGQPHWKQGPQLVSHAVRHVGREVALTGELARLRTRSSTQPCPGRCACGAHERVGFVRAGSQPRAPSSSRARFSQAASDISALLAPPSSIPRRRGATDRGFPVVLRLSLRA